MALFITLAFALILPTLHAQGGSKKKAGSVYFNALQAIAERNFLKGVQQYYRFILTENLPLSMAIRTQDLTAAMAFFKKELADPAKADKAHLAIVLVDRILDRYDRAEKRLDFLREKYPKSVLLAFIKGELLLSRGERNLAIRVFGSLSRLPKPRSFPALAEYIMQRRGQGPKPDTITRRNFLMSIAYRHWDEMDFDGAKRVFRSIMEEFPDHPDAPRALIDLLIQMDKAEEAVQIVDGWAGTASEPLIAPLPLARIRYSQGRFDEVVTLLTPLREADSQDMYLKLLMAESLYQTNNLASAASLFDELSAADTRNQGFLQRYVACCDVLGRGQDALPRLEAYVAENANDSMMRFELAMHLVRAERLEEARLNFLALKEYGNPYRKEALEQITFIDRITYERLMNSPNASGTESVREQPVTGTGDAAGQSAQPTQEPVAGTVKSAGSEAGEVELEQIRRMKELFK